MERVKDFFTLVVRVARQTAGVEVYQMARDMGKSRRDSLRYAVGEFAAPALFRVIGRERLVIGREGTYRNLLKFALSPYPDIIGGVGGMVLVRNTLNNTSIEDSMLNIALQLGVKLAYNAAVHTTANLLHDAGRPNIGIRANPV